MIGSTSWSDISYWLNLSDTKGFASIVYSTPCRPKVIEVWGAWSPTITDPILKSLLEPTLGGNSEEWENHVRTCMYTRFWHVVMTSSPVSSFTFLRLKLLDMKLLDWPPVCVCRLTTRTWHPLHYHYIAKSTPPTRPGKKNLPTGPDVGGVVALKKKIGVVIMINLLVLERSGR